MEYFGVPIVVLVSGDKSIVPGLFAERMNLFRSESRMI